MSVIDISKIQYKLIGVCALKNAERDLLKSIWTERFTEQTAFFAEVQQEDSALTMAQKIYSSISHVGYSSASGFQVILAMFVDLTEAMDEAYVKALSELPTTLSTKMKCSVRLHLLFGYTGMCGLKEGEDIKLMKQNVKTFVDHNPYSKGVYLVGVPAFGGTPEFRWKSVCLYLDLLRREATLQRLQAVSHNNGTVGFLRYGEYDEQLLVKLKEEEKMLTANLGDYGHVEFPSALNTRLAAIETEVRTSFTVDASVQPIHPDMIVSGFWNIHKAKHNNNDAFNRARAQTLAALRETGDGMVQQVLEFYKQKLSDPKQFLMDIFSEIHAGIGFVSNRSAIQSLLKHQLQPVQDAMPPALTYNENGYQDEIGSYLSQKLHYSIYKAKLWVYETLNEAYANFSDHMIGAKRAQMLEELNSVQNSQNHVASKKDFCGNALGNGDNMDAQFEPVLGASDDITIKHLVCRTDVDRAWIESNCYMGIQQEARFFIHETLGGLVHLDEAPLKTVQAMLFNCTKERLDDLLR